jgi:penicillin-binding protein 1A
MATTAKSAKRGTGKRKGRGKTTRVAKSRRVRGWLRRGAYWFLVLSIWAGLGLAGLFAYYAYDLPNIDAVEGIVRAPNVTLVTVDGTEVASFGGHYGEPVVLADLPPHLPRAVIAVEDRRFYRHFGIDLRGLARATVRNLTAGRIVEGGSTITQQLAKNLFLTPERTIKRKVQEVMLALWLERRFTKDQILTIYLNRVYLGSGAYGVDAAARRYFGKPANDVTLYEAALVAGLLKAPSRLNPMRNPNQADTRAALVLGAMLDVGFIDETQHASALTTKTRSRPVVQGGAPYFADWIMAQLRGYLGEVNRDIKVVTTLDPRLQEIAREELRRVIETQGVSRGVDQGALVILSEDGAVRAMVGGRDYAESQFNRATQALRQPGSAFKPFVYLTALETGEMAPDTRVVDEPVDIAGWKPRNFNDKYYGDVTLRESFARSLNSIAAQMVRDVGPRKVVDTARRLGITTELEANGSIALGASEVTLLELTGAFAAFAADGRGVWPHGILEIRSGNGEVFYRRLAGSGPGQVMRSDHARQMVDMMHAVVEWGSGKAANPGRPSAGKTGTSQQFRDAWFVGFSGGLVTGVWYGNDDNGAMEGVTGGSLPAQAWRQVMIRALEGETPEPLTLPTAVVEAEPGDDEGGGFLSGLLTRLTSGDKEENKTSREQRIERYFQPRDDRR